MSQAVVNVYNTELKVLICLLLHDFDLLCSFLFIQLTFVVTSSRMRLSQHSKVALPPSWHWLQQFNLLHYHLIQLFLLFINSFLSPNFCVCNISDQHRRDFFVFPFFIRTLLLRCDELGGHFAFLKCAPAVLDRCWQCLCLLLERWRCRQRIPDDDIVFNVVAIFDFWCLVWLKFWSRWRLLDLSSRWSALEDDWTAFGAVFLVDEGLTLDIVTFSHLTWITGISGAVAHMTGGFQSFTVTRRLVILSCTDCIISVVGVLDCSVRDLAVSHSHLNLYAFIDVLQVTVDLAEIDAWTA